MVKQRHAIDERRASKLLVHRVRIVVAVGDVATNVTADTGTFKKLCVTKSDGTPVCITGDALDQILTNESVSPAASAPSVSTPPTSTTPIASSSPDTAPSTATTTIDAPSIVPDYNGSITLPSAPALDASASPTVEEATSTTP